MLVLVKNKRSVMGSLKFTFFQGCNHSFFFQGDSSKYFLDHLERIGRQVSSLFLQCPTSHIESKRIINRGRRLKRNCNCKHAEISVFGTHFSKHVTVKFIFPYYLPEQIFFSK